jgi:hypothetical protein
MNFFVLLASVRDLVGWFISTVWSNGTSKRSKRHRIRDVFNTTSKSSFVRSVKSNTHNISKNIKKSTKFCLSLSQKEITSLWRHLARIRDTLSSSRM